MTAIAHTRAGTGEPLVLIHGVGHYGRGWDPLLEPLTREFEVIACDSPGFGSSPPLPGGAEPTIEAYTGAYQAFFEEAGIDRPHVAGNSMGGGIALELARRGAVRSVTAISPVGFWSPLELRYSQLALGIFPRMPRLLRPGIRALARTRPGRVALLSVVFAHPTKLPGEEGAAMLANAFASEVMADVLDAFSEYWFERGEELRGVPVTIAWGSRDRLTIYRPQSARARAALPHAAHVTLPGLGHTPFWDDPGMLARVIRDGARRT